MRDNGEVKLARAVECKNLRPNFPLLVSAVPRVAREAFHDCIAYWHEYTPRISNVNRRFNRESAYAVDGMVGKKIDQVRRDRTDLISDDSATFDKVSQAVSSCKDLIRECASDDRPSYRRVVLPVLVVPNHALWQVDYSTEGKVKVSPRCVERSNLFIHHTWSTDQMYVGVDYCLSQLEIVTIGALTQAVSDWFGDFGLP